MEHLIFVGRTAVLYFFLLVILRIMGKRELGQLSPFDFVVAIMIAEIAAIPMEDDSIPLLHGVIPIITLGILEIIVSYVTLKNEKIRKLINGTPSIVIKNGIIVEEELKKSRCNINDLLIYLREKDVFDISDVEFALLEPSGKLSLILKSQKRPVTPEDLNISTTYEGLPTPLITDGVVHYKHLKNIGLDENWLREELRKLGFNSFGEILLASINSKGELYVSPKNTSKRREKL